MQDLLIEAIAVGVLLLIISIPVMGLLHTYFPNDYAGCENLPKKCKGKYYLVTIFIGILTHLTCEFLDINKWYCKNGVACRS